MLHLVAIRASIIEAPRRAATISTSDKSLLAEREKRREKGAGVSFVAG
jgi:hypothetical protein